MWKTTQSPAILYPVRTAVILEKQKPVPLQRQTRADDNLLEAQQSERRNNWAQTIKMNTYSAAEPCTAPAVQVKRDDVEVRTLPPMLYDRVCPSKEQGMGQLDSRLRQGSRTDVEENPAAIEGLLLLQHSVAGEECVEVGGGQVKTSVTGMETPCPRQRTASLSKLYQRMQENPEMKDPVARARVKLDESGSLVGAGEGGRSEESLIWGDAIHDAVYGFLTIKGRKMPVGVDRGEKFYRGVYIHKIAPMPYSVIKHLRKQRFLGYFRNVLEAARAWDLAALKRAMESRRPLWHTKLNFPLEEYLDNQNLIAVLVQYSFDEVVTKLRASSNASRSQSNVKVEDLLRGKDIPESDDQEGNVKRQAMSCMNVGNIRCFGKGNNDTALVRKSVRQLRTLHSGSQSAQNTWIKRLRDDHKFKGVYFSRDGVPYSKVELEGKYHYLGRFDTIEEAARAYDLATLKRAMLHSQSSVSLNFPPEDYTQDDELMGFIKTSSCSEVAQFIRNLAQNRRGTKPDCVSRSGHRASMVNKRARMNSSEAHVHQGCRKPQNTLSASPSCLEGFLYQSEPEKANFVKMPIKIPGFSWFPVRGRGICDEKFYKRVSEKKGWVQVGVNTFAVEITQQCFGDSDMIKRIPDAMAMWFGNPLETHSRQDIELIDPECTQSYYLTFTLEENEMKITNGWSDFAKEAKLQSGEVLIFMRTDCAKRLRYTVVMSYRDMQNLSMMQSRNLQNIPLASEVRFPSDSESLNMAPVCKEDQLPEALHIHTEDRIQLVLPSTSHNKASTTGASCFVSCKSQHETSTFPEAEMLCPAGAPSDVEQRVFSPVSPPTPSCAHTQLIGHLNCLAQTHQEFAKPINVVTSRVPVTSSAGTCDMSGRSKCGKMYLVSDNQGQVRLVDEEGLVVNASGTIVVDPSGSAVLSPKTPFQGQESKVRLTSDTQQIAECQNLLGDVCQTGKVIQPAGPDCTHRNVAQSEFNWAVRCLDTKVGESPRDMPLMTSKMISKLESNGLPEESSERDCVNWVSEVFEVLSSCKGLDNRIISRFTFSFVHDMNKNQQWVNFTELIALSKAGKQDEIVKWVEESVLSM